MVLSVPGTSYIALEVPNPVRQTVRLKEILQSEAYETSKSLLTLAIGKDIAGRPFVMDLAKTPHLLVAGTTGSGKSVGINAMILSMLYARILRSCVSSSSTRRCSNSRSTTGFRTFSARSSPT